MITVERWAEDLLSTLQVPVTPRSCAFLAAWALGENTAARFNPLATTWVMPGDSWFNSFGPGGREHVRNYRNYGDGLRATVATLRDGHYPHVLEQLASGLPIFTILVNHEIDVWGTGGTIVSQLFDNGRPRLDWQPPSLRDVNESGPGPAPSPAPPALPKETPSMVIVTSKEHNTTYVVDGGRWTALTNAEDANAAIAAGLPHFMWTVATIKLVSGL